MNTYSIRMPGYSLKKERWTITFDHKLKNVVQKEARKLHIYPVQLLETLVREKLNPYGFQSIRNSVSYVNALRQKNAKTSDKVFLADLRKWPGQRR